MANNFMKDETRLYSFFINISSMVFFLIILLTAGGIVYITHNLVSSDHSNFPQIMNNIGIGLFFFSFMFVIDAFLPNYLYRKYTGLSPQTFLLSEGNSFPFDHVKISSSPGRTYLIDKNSFSYLPKALDAKFSGLMFSILFEITVLSFFEPYFFSAQFNLFKNYPDLIFVLILMLFLLLLPIHDFFFPYSATLKWKFEKENSDTINLLITNLNNKTNQISFNKTKITSFEITSMNMADLFPTSKFSEILKSTSKRFVLSINLDLKTGKDSSIGQYFLCINYSKEYLEIIKDLLLKWFNYQT